MAKEMLINVSEGEECRIALLEDGKLEELYMERTSSTSHVGNIYKGRVTNVEPSIQAAFIDFGLGRNGFLHISDLMPTYFGRRGEDVQESVGRKMARRDRPPIQRCLRRGDEIVVQIIKEGIGTKGPTLTTYLSVPGKILVMMPGMDNTGVSRKIEDDEERRRLRQILDALKPPDDAGFIIRTAGVGASKAEIQRDLTYLTRLWTTFKKKRDSGAGPMELYTEGDLVTRTVRDVFTSEVDLLVVDNKDVAKRVKDVVKLSSPRTKNKVELYEDPIPLFTKYGIEREIEMMYSRHVPLPSGGSLVIDSTEAIVAIDVNSGKFRDHSDAETTAFKTDMEAADEICRQLKLRDLGGVIICDFIDLRYERHRRDLEKRLHDNLKDDRAKTKVLRMSQFGIIEMTRQRMRPSLKRSVYFDCPHCKGAGLVKTPESMSLDVMRRLRIAINDLKVQRLELAVCPDVAFYLQNKKRQALSDLEHQYDKRILIRADIQLGLDEMKVDLYDNRDGLVYLESLGMLAQPPHTTQLGTKPQPLTQQRGGRGGRDDRGRGGRRPEPQRQQHGGGGQRHHEHEEELPEDRFERVEDEFEREPDHDEQEQPQPAEARGRDDRRGGDQRGPGGEGRRDQGRQRDQQQRGRQEQQRRGGERDDRHAHRSVHEEAEEAPGLETEAGGEAADVTEAGVGHENRGPQQGNGHGEEGGGGRRRRRRRGRRGRGRNRQGAEGLQPAANNGYAPAEGHSSDNGNYAHDDESAAHEPTAAQDDTSLAEAIVEEDVIEANEHGQITAERIETTAYVDDRADEQRGSREPEPAEPEAEPPAAEEPAPAEEPPAEAKPKRRRGTRGGRGRTKKKATAKDAEAETAEPAAAAESMAPAPEPAPVRTGSTDRHLIEDEPAFTPPVRRPRSARDLDSIPDDYE
ncbi:MAG TPA: Rne/Rng family ribonuclease [Tepidisphaeraceae bacterium]|jgi:ribonuclease E